MASRSRYENREIRTTNEELYRNSPIFKNRRLKFVQQYETPHLKYPNDDELELIDTVNHIWKIGDRFYKLADKYYGNSEFWWIIAWFNQTPLEGHVAIGDVVYIPTPLNEVLAFFE